MTDFVTPVTILSGFLGSGKTTLLNRILTERHGTRFVVIENEFGEVDIDSGLVIASSVETVVQLDNGCVCCTVRGDMAMALGELVARKAAGEIAFEHVLIECSGLADPGPLIQTFLVETELLSHFALDGLIVLADAPNLHKALDASVEAAAQLGVADRIILTKADQVSDETIAMRKAALRGLNASAPILDLNLLDSDLEALFEELLCLRAYELDGMTDYAPVSEKADYRHAHDHHTHGVSSVSFVSDRPFDSIGIQKAFAAIRMRHGGGIWRLKGILDIEGMRKRVIVQGVQEILQVNEGRVWRPFEPRGSRVAIIGISLDCQFIENVLEGALNMAERRAEAASLWSEVVPGQDLPG